MSTLTSDSSEPDAPAPDGAPAARVVAIANQKGGVGKTTTAINLATALAQAGRRVVVIDLDPQGNASTGLGIDRKQRRHGAYELLFGDATVDAIALPTEVEGLRIVTATQELSGAELELVDADRREFKLRDALLTRLTADVVLIDCPPALGLLTLNALVAADAVLVPLQCEFYALEGLSQLVRTIERTKRNFNPELEILGVVLTMYDKRNNLSDQVAADVRGFFGDKVYETMIPRNVRLSEAPSFGKPALLYDAKSSGALAYVQLAEEMLAREAARPSGTGAGGSAAR